MNTQEKMVELAWEGLKTLEEVDISHETYLKSILASELNQAMFNVLETYEKNILDKAKKRK